MKKLIILSLAALFSINQAFGASTTGSAGVKIFQALTIEPDTALNFGSIAPGSTDGTITLSADAVTAPNVTGGITIVTGSTNSAGKFIVSGETDATYILDTIGDITLALVGGSGTTMTVSDVTTSAGRTLTNGTNDLFIGGTLNVAANQAAGVYAGIYNVTANY
jgi:hypothetical protein